MPPSPPPPPPPQVAAAGIKDKPALSRIDAIPPTSEVFARAINTPFGSYRFMISHGYACKHEAAGLHRTIPKRRRIKAVIKMIWLTIGRHIAAVNQRNALAVVFPARPGWLRVWRIACPNIMSGPAKLMISDMMTPRIMTPATAIPEGPWFNISATGLAGVASSKRLASRELATNQLTAG